MLLTRVALISRETGQMLGLDVADNIALVNWLKPTGLLCAVIAGGALENIQLYGLLPLWNVNNENEKTFTVYETSDCDE